MNKNFEITVTKEDYWKVREIVKPYVKHWIQVESHDVYDTIIFPCSIFKIKRCKHDIDLAIVLGVQIKSES